jgi:hypothetical protein
MEAPRDAGSGRDERQQHEVTAGRKPGSIRPRPEQGGGLFGRKKALDGVGGQGEGHVVEVLGG